VSFLSERGRSGVTLLCTVLSQTLCKTTATAVPSASNVNIKSLLPA
jgi:hypothetical protein